PFPAAHCFTIHDLRFTIHVLMSAANIETIVSLAKRRGFVFPSSEIYGGLGSAWDYGPLGVELCNNVKQAWWRWMVYERDDIEGLDSSIILNRLVWKYSGHEDTFSDPLIDCRECKSRFRADKLIQEFLSDYLRRTGNQIVFPATIQIGKPVFNLPGSHLFKEEINCPNCGKRNWTD